MKEKKASQESQSRAMLYIQMINKYMKFKLMFVFSSASRKAAELFQYRFVRHPSVCLSVCLSVRPSRLINFYITLNLGENVFFAIQNLVDIQSSRFR